jgi:hypothetical protein
MGDDGFRSSFGARSDVPRVGKFEENSAMLSTGESPGVSREREVGLRIPEDMGQPGCTIIRDWMWGLPFMLYISCSANAASREPILE